MLKDREQFGVVLVARAYRRELRLTMELGKAASSVNKSSLTCKRCKVRTAQNKSRRSEASLTVVVVEYQAAFTPSGTKSGLFVLSLIWPAGRVSKLCQDI